MYHQVTQCRACGFGRKTVPSGIKSNESNDALIPVFDLGLQPLANDFCKPGEEQAGFAPLKVMFCPICTNSQLSVRVNPEILYSHYNYVTSDSKTMLAHFEELIHEMQRYGGLGSVVEVGSNDGKFLAFLKERGACAVVGVDPAKNLCVEAGKKYGVTTLAEPFDTTSARRVFEIVNKANFIFARHVFCHTHDWQEFMRALEILSDDTTVIFIEVPYVMDLLENVEFDTIYHEHLDYLSLRALETLLKGTALEMHRITRHAIHGGVINIALCRRGTREIHESVGQMLSAESLNVQVWSNFAMKAQKQIATLRNLVRELRQEGKRVAGFGASAKSTVIVNACKFGKHDLDFITDTTPQKQWTHSPGTSIPIVDPGALLRDLPDFAVMFCWNYREEVMKQQRLYTESGGQWIIPAGPDAKESLESVRVTA